MSESRPTHLDLFSGIGGFSLAAEWAGFRTIGFSEIDPYASKVLEKNFPGVRNYGDIRNIYSHPDEYEQCECCDERWCERHQEHFSECGRVGSSEWDDEVGSIDLLTGGFPCQPFSLAGKRGGNQDNRAIWPEMLRVIERLRPRWVIGENVIGIVSMELDSVLSDLEAIGYTVQPIIIPACSIGTNHIRRRVWIIAHSACKGLKRNHTARNVAERKEAVPCEFSRRMSPPRRCRKNDGVSNRMDRIRGLGNAIVPQVAYQIIKEIRKLI